MVVVKDTLRVSNAFFNPVVIVKLTKVNRLIVQ